MVTMNGEISVLLVDDCHIFRDSLSTFLKKKTNFQVVGHAADGSEALIKYDQLTPDVVIMDVNMPILDGIEATKKLVTSNPEIKVIAYTFESDHFSKRAMLQAGACDFLHKAERPAKLVQAIEKAIAA